MSSSGGSREELKSLSFYRQLSWNGRVWQAALGATFVLSSRCGAIDAKLLQNLPLKVGGMGRERRDWVDFPLHHVLWFP